MTFRAASIRTKLTALMLLLTVAPFGVALAIVVTRDVRQLARERLQGVQLVARALSEYAAADIAFEDVDAAQRDLASLAGLADIDAAGLFDNSGRSIANYPAGVSLTTIPKEQLAAVVPGHIVEEDDHIDIYQPVSFKGTRYGTLVLQTSTASLFVRRWEYLVGVSLFALGGLAAAVVLAVVLQRMLARPILELTQIARNVAERDDYSLRMTTNRSDELGVLSTAMNRMIVEVGRRQAEAVAAVRVRDDFLSIAAHELRTPLTTLELQLQTQARRIAHGEDDPARRAKSLEVMSRQCKRLEKLVANLLDVSRITAGRLDLEREEFDLARLAGEVAERLPNDLAASGSALHIVAPEPVVGHWDILRMDQVITNLLTNAIKYGAGKPITLSIAGDSRVATLSVRDEGIGIAEEDLQRVFERFERAVSGRNYGGLGLGLFISKEIVAAHGGEISIVSAPGAGSTFTVELPI